MKMGHFSMGSFMTYMALEWNRGWSQLYFEANLTVFHRYINYVLVLQIGWHLHMKALRFVSKQSTPASPPFKGQATELITLKWAIKFTLLQLKSHIFILHCTIH